MSLAAFACGAGALGFLVVAWTTSLYFPYLERCEARRDPDDDGVTGFALPHVTVVVPCYQEAANIVRKLENTASLRYPAGLRHVIVVDGGSDDGTVAAAEAFCSSHEGFAFSSAPSRGKIHQVNHALGQVGDGVILVTDVDGELDVDALEIMAAHYVDERVGCVGAFVRQSRALPEDVRFWRDQNAMRLLESRCGHASVVIAVAYSFRRSLFDRFPDDVVADDVYTAFRSNTDGFHTLYERRARAFELRSGSHRTEMFRHKLRKLNANMRELLRFLPEVRRMEPPWRGMFLTKFVQSWLMAPVLVGLAVELVWSLAAAGPAVIPFWCAGCVLLVGLQVLGTRRLAAVGEDEIPAGVPARASYVAMFLVLLVTGFFRYFVVHQSSSYRKVS